MYSIILEGNFVGSATDMNDVYFKVHQLANRIYPSGKQVHYDVIDSHNQKVQSGTFSA